MNISKKVLVVGATGQVGTPLTKQLFDMGVPVRVLTRDSKKVEHLNTSIERAVGDLDKPDTLAKAVAGIDSIFLITGNTQQDRNVIDAALKAGCRKIVKLSTWEAGSIPIKGPGQWHREREELIEASGLHWVFLRPTMMTSVTLIWKNSIISKGEVIFPGGSGKISPIHPADVASVAAVVLTKDEYDGNGYQLTGSELLSMAEMTKILSRVLGKPLQYIEQSADEVIGLMLKMKLPEYLAKGLGETYRGIKAGEFASCTDYIQQITGNKARTFEQWCRENADAFR
jgi:uncharacterized protein YbjT (DUF2867 family)